ncbi:MAG TPA: Rossmann-like and DUF2520 domain-containing protein [Terriglobales bacterium]
MSSKPRITIVGPGRLGTTLAVELGRAGYVVDEIIFRKSRASLRKARALARRTKARAILFSKARLSAGIIWFCVPDSEIARAARALASRVDWAGKVAFHSSGALPSAELHVVKARGAAIAAVHPMMTFVRGALPSLRGIPLAVEGDVTAVRSARNIVRALGGKLITVRTQDKTAYHAWGTLASPLLLATLVTAEQVARAAGLSAFGARKQMLPIVRQTIENYARLGPAAAFSGPIVRGDAEIVRQHLRMLNQVPNAREVYEALARAALRYLPVRNRGRLKKVLSAD